MVTKPYTKALPQVDEASKPFWDAAKEHRLVVQRCTRCSNLIFYPRELCPKCHALHPEWIEVSGKGRVMSFTVVRQPADPSFQEDVPYIWAVIQLAEGPRLNSNVTGIPIEQVQIDMPVEVWFDDVTPEVSLPKFRPVGTANSKQRR